MKKRLNSNGFVLAELIVAIALLAVVSSVILQMFMLSSTTNRNAKNLDTANAAAETALEKIKGSKMQFGDEFFSEAEKTVDGDIINLKFYFDENFLAADSKDAPLKIFATITPVKKLRGINSQFTAKGGEVCTGTLYEIELYVEQISEKTGQPEKLVELKSAKYVVESEAAQ